MNDPERVDLSLLDPARNPEHWSRLMEATRLRVEAVLLGRATSIDALAVVGGWARPILAAAALALVLLGAARATLAGPAPRAVATSDAQRLTMLTRGFIAGGHVPTGAELAAAIAARGGR
jgi:hypothetical protein